MPRPGGSSARKDTAPERILAALRRHGPLSRATLGRIAALSPAAVSTAVAALMADGLLLEAGVEGGDAASGPGRPGTLLQFNPAVGRAIGVWVGLDRVVLQLADFAGNAIVSREEKVAISRMDAEGLVTALAARISAFRDEAAAQDELLGLGIAFQGFVDRAAGRLVWSPVTPLTNLPLARMMEEATGLPVEIDNDASAMASAVVIEDASLRNGVTACVLLGDGVGLGLVVDGEPMRGPGGGGVEFGHIQLSPSGPQCRCGARGCVEAYAADYALYRDALLLAGRLPLRETRQPDEADMLLLADAARGGDFALGELFNNAARRIAQGVSTLINLFQPDNVVLCGPGVRAWDLLEPGIRQGLEANAIQRVAASTRLLARPFRRELMTEGVIHAVLGRFDRSARSARAAQTSAG
ncbi:MAG: ROK family protein [Beijerinckiaceae bacterium]